MLQVTHMADGSRQAVSPKTGEPAWRSTGHWLWRCWMHDD